jgi:FAD/FMN-containing dehydrogenase/Fe-S oxidoreductase
MKKAEQIGSQLASLVKGDVLIDIYNRAAFSTDASIYSIRPECVVAPKDEADVIAVVQYAHRNNIPIAPRGAGSGLAGESLTTGIVIDFRRYMNRVLDIRDNGDIAVCQPGVVLDKLNYQLAKYKTKIGPDPSSSNRAVIGGVVANNATGAHFLQYGYIANYVRSIRAILYDGSVAELRNNMSPDDIQNPTLRNIARQCVQLLAGKEELIANAQPRTKRNRCGYTIQNICHQGQIDLARLMAGSEGTLVVFTEIELATVDVPAVAGLLQLEFASFEAMAKAVPIIVKTGASACELMDQRLMTMARKAFPSYRDVLPENCVATLLVEQVGGSIKQVREKLDRIIDAAGNLSCGRMEALDSLRQAKLWKSRKDAVPLLNRDKGAMHPVAFVEDVSVEPGLLDKYVAGLENIGKKYAIPMAFYGHAGDGELHIRPYLDLSSPDDIKRMCDIAEDVFELAWSLGGSISGEHADGLVRSPFIERQYGKAYYQLLVGIKNIFDPAGILNPGKIINPDPDVIQKNLRGMELAAAEGLQTELQFADRQYRYEIEQCNGCGVCLAEGAGRMCPVFRVTDEELATPRGKANLLRNWISGTFDEKQGSQVEPLRKILSLCVNCRMCSLECPAGVDMSKLIVEARAKLAKYGGFSVTEFALSNNRWMSILASTFAPLSNWIMRLGLTRRLLEKTMGFDRGRTFPVFERGSFIKKANRYLRQAGPVANPVDKAVYFADSYARYNDHNLGLATIKVLRHFGVEVVIPDQRPAPLPAYVYGNLSRARKDMAYNLRTLWPYVQQGYKVVCSEPSAAMFLKDELPLLIATEPAKAISAAAVELMEYLNHFEISNLKFQIHHIRQQPPSLPKADKVEGSPSTSAGALVAATQQKVAYHAPCHLKSLNGAMNTIELFRSLGLVVEDLNGGCCGLAGTTGMQTKNRDLCDAIGRPLKETIEKTGPDCVLTECAACKMQIEHLTGKRVLHPVMILIENFSRLGE